MNIQINKQVELMWGLLQCSDYVNIVPIQCQDTGNEFRKKNIEFLSQFKNEKVFTLLNELVNDKTANFNWDAPNDIALAMDENYNFFGHNCSAFTGKLHSNPKVLEFLKELKIFAEKVDYSSLFSQYQEYFKHITQEHKKTVDKEVDKVFDFMKKFYMFEPKQENYSMNLLLSVSQSGIGSHVLEKVYVSDSLKRKQNSWSFIPHENNEEYICHILHEFSHPIINPLTDKYKIDSSFIKDWDYINNRLGVGYMGHPRSYVNEALIRATQIYFLEKVYNYPTEERIQGEEGNNGYLHIRELIKELYNIENKRYENFEDKYLDLLKVFTKEVEKDIVLQ